MPSLSSFRLPSLSRTTSDLLPPRDPNPLSASIGDLSELKRSHAQADGGLHSFNTSSISPVSLSSRSNMNEATGPETTEHLLRLNNMLLAALRSERERCSALEAALLKVTGSGAAAEAATAAEMVARPTTTPSRGALRRLSTNPNGNNIGLVASRSFGSKLSRRGPKRSRVDPKTGPLKAGALLPASLEEAALMLPPPQSFSRAVEEAPPPSWPEPSSSPAAARRPTRGSQRWPKPAETAQPAGAAMCLSAALATRVRRALADELQRLQEQMASVLSEGSPDAKAYEASVRSLSRRLGWLRSDVAALAALATAAPAPSPAANIASTDNANDAAEKPTAVAMEAAQQLASTRCDDLDELYELAANAEEFVQSLRGELVARERAEAERRHADALCEAAGFRVVGVPKDGDCLFSCAKTWLAQRTDEPASDADLEAAATSQAAAARAERQLAALACGSAAEVRTLVVATLRDMATNGGDEEAVKGIDEAINAAAGGASDATSVALRAALERRRLAADDEHGNDSAAARESYLRVMGTVGIYGERLEIRALSALARAPVHIFYHLEAAEGVTPPSMQQPTEVVTAAGVAAEDAPLRLLHRVCDRHFDLLLPASALAAAPSGDAAAEADEVASAPAAAETATEI